MLADSGPVARGFVAVAPIAGLIVTITVIAMLRSLRENGGTSGVDWVSQPMAVAVVKEPRYTNATTSEGELHDVSVDVLTTDGREFPGVVRMGLDGFEARKLVPGTLIPVHHFAGDPERLAPIARSRRGSDDVVATLRAGRDPERSRRSSRRAHRRFPGVAPVSTGGGFPAKSGPADHRSRE